MLICLSISSTFLFMYLFFFLEKVLVYVSNRTMMWPFLMMWKLRFKKKSYTISFSNLYIIGIEKSRCLLLTNWCVIDVKIKKKKLFIMWWSDTDYNYHSSQIVGLVFHFGISPIFVMFLKLKSINLPSFLLCSYQIQAF